MTNIRVAASSTPSGGKNPAWSSTDDRCILLDKEMVSRLIRAMHLPPHRMTEIGTDSHYRCHGCMPEYRLDEDDDL
jgi:hypothetical protein